MNNTFELITFAEFFQMATLITGFIISYIKITGSVKKNIKKVDAIQNEKIEKIEKSMVNMNKYIDNQSFNTKLRETIDLTIFSIIETNGKSLDNSMQSLLIEGSNEAYYFFKRIREVGYENININIIEKQGMQIFRKLRSDSGGNVNLNKTVKDLIKNKVAYPSLRNLMTKLILFKKGTYNGTSDKRFLEMASGFVSEIANNSISVLLSGSKKAS